MVAVSTSKRLSPKTRATVGFRSHLAEVVMVVAEAAAVAAMVEVVTSTATMEAAWVVVITR